MTNANTKPARKRGAHWVVWTLPAMLLIVAPMTNHFIGWHLFRQPSGSMLPTLHIGDTFAVSKWSYGYSRYSFAPFHGLLPRGRWLSRVPERGDLVVFRPAPEPDRDFVKRLVGLPGDRIQMIDGVLHINGAAVEREALGLLDVAGDAGVERIPAFRETLPNGVSYITLDRTPNSEIDNTSVFVVPAGAYFVMGDDRDNSADSRVSSVVGYVPSDNLIGRVDYVF
jgi:signal peptidase I